jgi:hypothetical protein
MKIISARLALAISVSLGSGVLLADTINSVSCSTPGAMLVTGSSSCSASDYGYASASSVSSVTLPGSAGQALEIDSNASGSALLGGVRGIGAFSTAEASSDVSINLDTAGPVRNGYLELNFLQDSWTAPAFGSLSELLTIGTYSASPDGQDLSVFIPVQLGTDFSLNFLGSLTVNGDAATGAASGAIGADISLLAFEADQTTPVQLSDPPSAVPEPASFGMMALGVLTVAGLLRRR